MVTLDLACGNYKAPGSIGVDVNRRSFDSKPVAADVIASAYALPFKSNVFSFIICRHYLEHCDALHVLKEANRVAKSRCKLLVEIPNPLYLFIFIRALLGREHEVFSGENPHIHCFARPELRNLLRESGFKALRFDVAAESPERFCLQYTKRQAIINIIMQIINHVFPLLSRHMRVYAIKAA